MSFGIAVGIAKDEEETCLVWVVLRSGDGVGIPADTARMVATQLLLAADLIEKQNSAEEK